MFLLQHCLRKFRRSVCKISKFVIYLATSQANAMGNDFKKFLADPISIASFLICVPISLWITSSTDNLSTWCILIVIITFATYMSMWFVKDKLIHTDWICIGCKETGRAPLPNKISTSGLYEAPSNFKYYSSSPAKQFVCRHCYSKTQDEAHWSVKFDKHRITDADRSNGQTFTKRQAQ